MSSNEKLNEKNREITKEVLKTAEANDDAAENASLLKGVGTGKASSHGSSSKTGGRARMIHETFGTKLNSMFMPIFSVLANIGVLVFIVKIGKGEIIIQMDSTSVFRYFPVLLLVVLEVSNIITFLAIDKACAILFGYLLSTKKGFSLTACGFTQTPALLKFKFASELPLQSKSQKFLRRLAVIWILLFGVKGAFFFAATTVGATQISPTNSALNCEWYTQVGYPVDRGWPTFQVESGVAEYVFGTSIGVLRSEVPDAKFTTAIIPPNIIAAVNHGDTILGPGFTAVVNSTCDCANGMDFASLVSAGIDASQVNQSLAFYQKMQKETQPGITWAVTNTSEVITITNMLSALNVCGGNQVMYPLVCKTNIGQHRGAHVSAKFMTDGTSASIALDIATVIEDKGPVDNLWLIQAMKNILGTHPENNHVTFNYLPAQTANQVSPLLWWTTPNLLAVDRAFLDAGLETTYCILMRGAVQRTYGTQGGTCPRTNTAANQLSQLDLTQEGLLAIYICSGFQLFLSVAAVAIYIPWIISESPISPCIRAVEEVIYFVVLLSTSRIAQGLYEYSNAETFEIWQSLDVIVRIGEALNTVDEDIGQIVADKPKYVRPFTNSRRYT